MMKRAALLVSVLAVLAIAATPTAVDQDAASGWRLVKQTDQFTDSVSYTAVVRSADGQASLRVHCGGGNRLLVMLSVPSSLRITLPRTLVEIRFDREEPSRYVIDRITMDMLVSRVGGSPKDAHYLFATMDAIKKVTPESVQQAGATLTQQIRARSRFAYRFLLSEGGGPGAEGSFSLTGFTRVAAPMLKSCGAA